MYYKRLDPEAKNEIGAMDAAKFLKNSGLADEFLGKVKTSNTISEISPVVTVVTVVVMTGRPP